MSGSPPEGLRKRLLLPRHPLVAAEQPQVAVVLEIRPSLVVDQDAARFTDQAQLTVGRQLLHDLADDYEVSQYSILRLPVVQ
jgi:hypothetical protein